MNIIPDKFIMLDIGESLSVDKVKRNLKSEDEIINFGEEEITSYAYNALTEYRL